jgi:hypothetical protein
MNIVRKDVDNELRTGKRSAASEDRIMEYLRD